MAIRRLVIAMTVFILFAGTPSSDAAFGVRYSGYLVDNYCYGRVQAGQLALDRTDPLREPWKHTLHCMRDVGLCRRGGFYLAQKNLDSGKYLPRFLFDDDGNGKVLALLDAACAGGRCGPSNDRTQVTVTALGTDNGDGILRDVTLSECHPPGSAECDGVLACVSGCAPPAPIVTDGGSGGNTNSNSTNATEDSMFMGNGSAGGGFPGGFPGSNVGGLFPPIVIELEVPALLWAHVLCMLISWGCLLPVGVIWAHNMRFSDQKWCQTPIWFQGHRILQSIGWLFQLLGFIFIFLHKGGFAALELGGHFQAAGLFHPSVHEVIGLIVVILGTLQPLNALVRHLPFIGHPAKDGSRPIGRLIWEIVHKGFGYIAVVFGLINVVLGIIYADSFGFSGPLVPTAIAIAATCFGIVVTTCGATLACGYSKYEEISTSASDEEASN